jgi:hypothetical protein
MVFCNMAQLFVFIPTLERLSVVNIQTCKLVQAVQLQINLALQAQPHWYSCGYLHRTSCLPYLCRLHMEQYKNRKRVPGAVVTNHTPHLICKEEDCRKGVCSVTGGMRIYIKWLMFINCDVSDCISTAW